LQEAQKGSQNCYRRGSCFGHSFGLKDAFVCFLLPTLLFLFFVQDDNQQTNDKLLGLDVLDALLDGNNNNFFSSVFFS
jgi:hypothetical protein